MEISQSFINRTNDGVLQEVLQAKINQFLSKSFKFITKDETLQRQINKFYSMGRIQFAM